MTHNDAAEPYRLIEENLRRAMTFYGRALSGGQYRETGGVEMICSGTNMPMFNPALLTEPVTSGELELDRRITIPAVHFGHLGFRWSYWLCEEMLSGNVRRAAAAVFARRGMRRVTSVPGMIADRLALPVRPLPEIEIRRVADAPTRRAFAMVTAFAFDLPSASSREIYESESAWQGDFHGFVGYRNGEPVSTAGVTVTRDVVGFYSVGTLPASRKQGYAEALMRRAFLEVSDGRERAVLQSTAAGQRLYEQMGFRTVARFSIYVSP